MAPARCAVILSLFPWLFSASALAQSCTFTLSSDQLSYPQRGGAGVVKVVSSSSSCARAASAAVSWITLDYGQQGTGNGTIGFTVAPNNDTPMRSGAINVGTQGITITQAGPPCNFAINPSSSNISASAQSGSFALTGLSGCTWTAASNADWLQLVSAPSGLGPATLSYTVRANPSTVARSGIISVAGLTFTVNQSGLCVFTLMPTSGSYASLAGNGAFMVNTNAGCAWTSTASASWIRITAGQSHSGPGEVTFTMDPNAGAARTGAIKVADQTFAVAQASLVCSFTLAPSATAIPSNGGTATFAVSAADGCAWAAQTNAAWITIITGQSSSKSGIVAISAAGNSGDARSGTVTVGGQIFTVTQAAAPMLISANSIANAASNVQGAVSPGELVVISAAGIGPATTLPAQLTDDGAYYTTALGETRILFDGIAAPMVYASSGQFSAVVPYEIAGNPSTEVQIEFQGILSNSATLPVVPSQPGIITTDSSGTGSGMILDAASNLNSADNPAAAGSVVTLYVTGEGQTSPPGIDGKLAVDPFPAPILPVTVSIDGIDAPVLRASQAAGQVGLMQVDVQIPDGATSGARPVIVQVGDAQSRPDVTVAIQ